MVSKCIVLKNHNQLYCKAVDQYVKLLIAKLLLLKHQQLPVKDLKN